MTKENIVTLTASPSEGTEAKRNKKTQLLSALLSASALGLFLEGCSSSSSGGGGEDTSGGDGRASGSRNDPYLATASADYISGFGFGSSDWVSYAGSNAGVTIDLSDLFATGSGGWAAGDSIRFIDNLIGSRFADTLTGDSDTNSFEGGRGNDVLAGGSSTDTYVFNAGDGTDRVIDTGGNIVFEQGTNNDYAGATYTFSDVGSNVRLTVTKGSNTLNTIDFTGYPSSYDFYTRSGGSDTEIHESSLMIPGSASNPYLATDAADIFTGSGSYDWVSYAESNEGVNINLGRFPITVSGGWAAGDRLKNIDNLIGSAFADTLSGDSSANSFEGGRGNDVLAGGTGIDTYVFNKGDGRDTITDSGGKIVFEQGTNNDYAGATYTFSNVGGNVRLTVTKGSNTLNTIDFSEYPSSYTFTTRSGGDLTTIPTSSLVFPDRLGSEDNPFLATAGADIFAGSGSYDWVSYAKSTSGVTISLNNNPLTNNPATVSGGWAAGDTLAEIDNLIGSIHGDKLYGDSSANTFEGGRGNDVLAGRSGTDTYVFNKGDGTDRITDSGGSKIVFEQGTNNNDYAGATYAFAYVDGDVRLTVTKGSNTLNTIDFTYHPSDYDFYTRSDGTDTRIPASSLAIPPRPGSESNPFLATDAADRFSGAGIYDWVSYADSNEGVTITLIYNSPATASGGWAAGDTLTNIDKLIGSRFADTLTGSIGGNTLRGGAGNDDIDGGNGNDILEGGRDNDILDGKKGNDILEGGRGNDVLTGGIGIDTYVFNKDDGTDTITDIGSNKIVFDQGTNNNDYAGATYAFAYVEGSSDVRLTVTKGSETLNTIDFTYYPAADYDFATRSGTSDTAIPASSLVLPTRWGDESNPFLATSDADSFTGSYNYDWVSYAGSNEGVNINLGTHPDTLSGGWAAEDTLTYINNIIGSDYADTLTGDTGANTLRGGAGRDTFNGGAGNDELYGGSGADTYHFYNSRTVVASSNDNIIRDGDTDGTGNKLIFHKPDPDVVLYYESAPLEKYEFQDVNFNFRRSGDDLKIAVTFNYLSSQTNSIIEDTSVTIEDYFTLSNTAYTIYSAEFGSTSDGTIVSTQPAETS